ncbi:MAG TPA: hypothetical protein VK814_18905 [Acidobacteriaceae bacterium]|jgi:hypothetical protein|nr:hypothetical protein [Acidobacteriaceae bacterium]
MKKALWIGAGVGFLMPIAWGCLSFVLFNEPEGPAAELYWKLNHFFCPLHALPTVIELPGTAAIYAALSILLVYCWSKVAATNH